MDKNGVPVDDHKVEKVRDAIPTTTRKELRSFLVLAFIIAISYQDSQR